MALASNNGYVMNNAAQVVGTLPASPAEGDVIEVSGKGAGGWKIAQNAGQQIHYGTLDTTAGTGGSLASTARRDSVRMVCVVAGSSAEWNVVSAVGAPVTA